MLACPMLQAEVKAEIDYRLYVFYILGEHFLWIRRMRGAGKYLSVEIKLVEYITASV